MIYLITKYKQNIESELHEKAELMKPNIWYKNYLPIWVDDTIKIYVDENTKFFIGMQEFTYAVAHALLDLDYVYIEKIVCGLFNWHRNGESGQIRSAREVYLASKLQS